MSNIITMRTRSRRAGAWALACALTAFVLAAAGRAEAGALTQGAANYKPFVVERIGIALDGARELQAAVKAGDVKAAQAAPTTRNTPQAELDEIAAFASVLDTAIPARNRELIALTVDTVGSEWRELGEWFPAATDSSVRGGAAERRRARVMASSGGDFDAVARAYADYRRLAAEAQPDLKLAEPWSLFNPPLWQAHFAALQRLAALAK